MFQVKPLAPGKKRLYLINRDAEEAYPLKAFIKHFKKVYPIWAKAKVGLSAKEQTIIKLNSSLLFLDERVLDVFDLNESVAFFSKGNYEIVYIEPTTIRVGCWVISMNKGFIKLLGLGLEEYPTKKKDILAKFAKEIEYGS